MILFLVGPPASGKSALARALLFSLCSTPRRVTHPVKAEHAPGAYVAAGHYTLTGRAPEPFEGADMLGFTQARLWFNWWKDHREPLCLLDGARFTSLALWDLFELEAPGECLAVHLSISEAEHRRRMSTRVQNSSWAKGAATRARNFATQVEALELQDVDPYPTARAILKRCGLLHPVH